MIIKNFDRENFRNADGINPFVSNFDPKKLKKSFLRDIENYKKKKNSDEKAFRQWFSRMLGKHNITFFDRVDLQRWLETQIEIEIKKGF